MVVRIYTASPDALLASVKNQIDQGHIDTWAYDSAGDFTHSVPQFNQKAWLSPTNTDDGLRMRILKPEGQQLPRAIYAIYHGRFIEMLITHVPKLFSRAVATSASASDEATPV